MAKNNENSYQIKINNEVVTVNATGDTPLLWALRDVVGLTGTKYGCGIAQCGCCTVLLDGNSVRSCILPLEAVGDRQVVTIEGVDQIEEGRKIQQAWLDKEVVQCGYCQSGMIMSATALLMREKNPDDEMIDSAMSGNICRCATYKRIREAIHQAAK